MYRFCITLALMGLFALYGCSQSGDTEASPFSAPSGATAAGEEAPPGHEESSEVEKEAKPEHVEKEAGVDEVEVGVLETKFGAMVIEFYPEIAPKTVARIKELVKKGFYDGLTFHRIEKGFCIQGGCPRGDGTGGSGVKIPGEFSKKPYVDGSVGMARGPDPNSGDCQFFITLGRAAFLDGKYTLFGQVIEGLEVAHEIEKLPVVSKGNLHYAREPVRITSFRLEKRKLDK